MSEETSQTPPPSTPEEGALTFFRDERRVLQDIAGASGFTFKRGNNWAIMPETGEATYDPKFFEDKGYTPSQALFGAFHEIKSHLVETADLLDTPGGQQAHARLKTRTEKAHWLHIWENCRTDIKGNRAIIQFAPSLHGDMQAVYAEKLWPETDFTDKPKHLQFMYAILRRAMLPHEEVTIDPEVQQAIDDLRHVKGKDVIALSTDPRQDPLLALRLSERYIEPAIQKLHEKDMEEKKQKGKGEEGQSGQADGQEPFEGDYQDYEDNRHAEPWDEEEIVEKIKETKDVQNAGNKQDAGYEEEHGVKKEEVADYYREYKHVDPYIEPLREIFRRIVEERKIPIRHLSALKEEGVMIDPGLVTQTYLDVTSGVSNPKTMKDFEGRVIDEHIPGSFSVRLVADLSDSMEGQKAIVQRRSAILVMEGLREFTEMLDDQQDGIHPHLDVETELRSFGAGSTEVHKPLSKELTEKHRVAFFKELLATGGGTNDYDALSKIEVDVKNRINTDPVYAQDLKSGKRREIVIVLSDGDSGNVPLTQTHAKNLRELGVKVVGLGMTKDATGITVTYAPDGQVCYDINELPTKLNELLSEYLGTINTPQVVEKEV